ncbi:MAG: SH3 domain-containing protein [Chloroflexus sp.]|jgi:hypothetical protein|nr:SH3 domain-containing protein [Chloroflexus sp.]
MSDKQERQASATDPRSESGVVRQRETSRTERLDATSASPAWRPSRPTRGGIDRNNMWHVVPRWLQQRGWLYVVSGFGLLVLIAILFLWYLRDDRREVPLGTPTTTSLQPGILAPTQSADETDASALSPVPAPTPAPRFFVVVNTGGQGLFLRPAPNRNNQPITTLPDGTRLEQIGEDVPGPDFVWRPVRTPDGLEGYVAVDFLAPSQ